MVTLVYLALGSNLGDPLENLRRGIALLGEKLDHLDYSSVYETAPVGVADQPDFLNMVIRGQTTLGPHELLSFVKAVEQRVGRRPTFRWGPRVLDVDILLYGQESIDLPDLKVPHPELLKRDFVLIPLCEIAPRARMPDGIAICRPGSQSVASKELHRYGSVEEDPGPACR